MKTENSLTFRIITSEDIEIIKSKKILFGHQSVGENILQGIQILLNDDIMGRINIVSLSSLDSIDDPVFSHCAIGSNTQPFTKLVEFSNLMNAKKVDSFDIAFMKFCYVDISKQTNIDSLFIQYKNTFSKLTEQHKNTAFIHFTTPLTRNPMGIKGKIKQRLKGSDNRNRNAFNELIRKEYGNRVFDLAGYESTYPDGSREVYNNIFGLIPSYTTDGGHLNEQASKIIAEQLLCFVARLN